VLPHTFSACIAYYTPSIYRIAVYISHLERGASDSEWRGEREAMKSNRNLSRAEGKRLGNVALIAFMLGSLLLLSLARAKFSPIGTLVVAMAFWFANQLLLHWFAFI
jgi:hypothetical protein